MNADAQTSSSRAHLTSSIDLVFDLSAQVIDDFSCAFLVADETGDAFGLRSRARARSWRRAEFFFRMPLRAYVRGNLGIGAREE